MSEDIGMADENRQEKEDTTFQKSTMKWVLIAKEPEELQAKCLSKYLQDKGFENHLKCISANVDDFHESLSKLKMGYDQIRVGPPFESILGEFLELTPSLTMSLRTADCIVKQQEKWWPRSTLNEAMNRVFAKEIKSLDFKSKALVVGVGAKARAVVMALLNAGYTNINFVSRNNKKSESLVKDLSRSYFGVQFDYYSEEELAYLPGIHSIVINTTPNIEENVLLKDLYFYNYLTARAVVVDLSREKPESDFLKQAKEIGLPIIDGNLVLAYKDCIWSEHVFAHSFDVNEYYQVLMEKCLLNRQDEVPDTVGSASEN